jgi:hypothetical protein
MIEHATRRCGKLASSLTSEQQLSARENLYFILSDLANRGINLWSITKQVLTLVNGQPTYQLAVGTVDLLKAFYRTQSIQTGTQISGTTYQGLDAGAGITFNPTAVQVTFNGAGTNTLVLEQSPDGATWTQVSVIPPFVSTNGQVLWIDLTIYLTNRAFRLRETVLGADLMGNTTWAFNPSAILMAKLNRDQYYLLPNRSFPGRALQYWYDKQVTPQIWAWPVPNDVTAAVECWTTMHIQDPGAYSNTIQLPQRWQNGVIWILAMYMANELPDVDPNKIALCAKMGMMALEAAENGESDGAPIQIDPGIAPYTK